jgi:hypothetical protein
MAILNTVNIKGFGDISDAYLTISDVNINFKCKSGLVHLKGYKTKEIYLADMNESICDQTVSINESNFNKYLTDAKLKVSGASLLKNLYLLILDEPEYQNAISDI